MKKDAFLYIKTMCANRYSRPKGFILRYRAGFYYNTIARPGTAMRIAIIKDDGMAMTDNTYRFLNAKQLKE